MRSYDRLVGQLCKSTECCIKCNVPIRVLSRFMTKENSNIILMGCCFASVHNHCFRKFLAFTHFLVGRLCKGCTTVWCYNQQSREENQEAEITQEPTRRHRSVDLERSSLQRSIQLCTRPAQGIHYRPG